MKLSLQRISYKLLVSTMIAIALSFFVVTSYSHANKFKDLVNDDGIYYTGTQEGTPTFKKGLWSNIVDALSKVASFLVGLITFVIRGVAIGWIEIAELILTSILYLDESLLSATVGAVTIGYTDQVVNVEKIIFNHVEMLNANIFKNIDTTKSSEEEKAEADIIQIIKDAVAKWYYILRLFAIAFMLIFLIFIGIKMAISTIASEKAIYKQMLVDWVVGMIIVFTIHYMMILIFAINDTLVAGLEPFLTENTELEEEYQYGIENKKLTNEDVEVTLYESARTRSYSLNAIDGFTGMVIYGVLVYYAWRFAIMYFLRVLNIMILTMVAPIIATSYAANKVISGKSKIFSSWLQEYIVNVVIQLFHAIIYVSFVSIALKLSMISLPGIIIAFVILNMMLKLQQMLRGLFKMSGGKGSLSGTMEKTGFKEMKQDLRNLRTAVVGGQIGTTAMKATYRLASKPLRVGAETALTKHMEKKAQKQDEEEERRLENLQRIQETINELKQMKSDKEALKRKEAEIEEKEQEIAQKYNENYVDGSPEIDELKEELYQLNKQRKEIIDAQKEAIEEKEEELEEMQMLQEYEEIERRMAKETFQGKWDNLWDAKNYVERITEKDVNGNDVIDADGRRVYQKDRNGKYVYRKIKARREGGEYSAFWRKKTDSVGKRFMDNAKWQKLTGIDEKEKKELQKQFKFWKSSILGLASSFVGFPALVVNPALGLGLLGQATISGLNFATKKRQVKNRPRYKTNKSYQVTAFNRGAHYTMQVEAARQIKVAKSRMAHTTARRHPKIVERIRRGDTYQEATLNKKPGWEYRRFEKIDTIDQEKLEVLGELKYRRKLKTALEDFNVLEGKRLAFDYKAKEKQAEEEQQAKAKELNIRQLLFNDKVGDGNVISVGDSLYQMEAKDKASMEQNMFLEKAEAISETGMSRTEKVKQIKAAFEEKKGYLVRNQITKYYANRGINDISTIQMSEEEVIEMKQNLIGILEEKGIIKKGEIKLEDNLVTNRDIQKGYQDLNKRKEKTNRILEQKISTNAILQYMQENNVQNLTELQTDEAKEGIYDIIKDKMMTDAEKVAQKIRGGEVFKLSNNMKQAVDTNRKKVKKVKLNSSNVKREKLVERETNRRMNQTKKQLEEAICEDTVENITDETTLDLLFALSAIGENNREAVEVLGKKPSPGKNQLEMLEFYQDGTRKLDKDGSRRLAPNQDNSQRIEDLFVDTKRKSLERRLFGSQNVIDLINQVK